VKPLPDVHLPAVVRPRNRGRLVSVWRVWCWALLLLCPPLVHGQAPSFDSKKVGQHPRLLMTAESLPQLRAFYESEEGKPWRRQLEAYLPASKPPKVTKFLRDATDAQRQGFWRLPTVALHYKLTGDPKSLATTKAFLEMLLALPHWEEGKEKDSGMGAANIMVGAALAYDWTHDDLDPAFREKFRQKLLHQARAMYRGGHQRKNPGPHYWQADPQNNHRWHRDAGLTLAVLAAYEGKPEEQEILRQTAEELAFINEWLPADGTGHESPSYLTFGGNHLVLAMQASDDLLGTDYLATNPFYKNVGPFLVGTLRPGFGGAMGFGDWGGNGIGNYNNFLLKTAAVHRQPEVKAALLKLQENGVKHMEFGWFNLLWDDPGLKPAKNVELPQFQLWPDLGLAMLRDGDASESDGVAVMFKCGPMGGHRLNEFRTRNNNAYINVAHDDPDANSFIVARGNELLAETDRYAKHKRSASHNTILVNGLGQMTKGRPEGTGWSQPGGDMANMAYLTGWRVEGGIAAVEGEAAGSYLAYTDKKTGKSRPALKRFRRLLVWKPKAYMLVIDEIIAPEKVDIAWLMQGPDLVKWKDRTGQFELKSKNASGWFTLQATGELGFNIAPSPADHRGKPLGFKQLTASLTGQRVVLLSLYQWRQPDGDLSLTYQQDKPTQMNITVKGPGIDDTWYWQAASPDSRASATLKGKSFTMTPVNSRVPEAFTKE